MYVNEVPYTRGKDIDFSSAQKLKTTLDLQIELLPQNAGENKETNTVEQRCGQQFGSTPLSDREMEVYAKLNNCHNKAVALSLIDPYANQFIDESRTLPTISELFQTKNLDLQYPQLLKLCTNITLNISECHINKVEICLSGLTISLLSCSKLIGCTRSYLNCVLIWKAITALCDR